MIEVRAELPLHSTVCILRPILHVLLEVMGAALSFDAHSLGSRKTSVFYWFGLHYERIYLILRYPNVVPVKVLPTPDASKEPAWTFALLEGMGVPACQ